jgi:hypothetical protein
MKHRSPWLVAPLVAIAFLAAARGFQSHSLDADGAAKDGVILTGLSDPVFPPLAKVARVLGDVVLTLGIRPDGSVQKVDIVSGPVMLQQAAKESAQRSQFECGKCSTDVTQYSLTYAFKYGEGDCCAGSADPPKTTWVQGHVTVVSPPICLCDPSADVVRVRSAKCLYLWKCSIR